MNILVTKVKSFDRAIIENFRWLLKRNEITYRWSYE